MDSAPSPLKIVYAPVALNELDEIWAWNVEHNGIDQAQAYLRFIRAQIDGLSTDPDQGRRVAARPDLHYITIRWRTGGHGQVAVYRVDRDSGVLTVAHVFHTRQDWQTRLGRGGT